MVKNKFKKQLAVLAGVVFLAALAGCATFVRD